MSEGRGEGGGSAWAGPHSFVQVDGRGDSFTDKDSEDWKVLLRIQSTLPISLVRKLWLGKERVIQCFHIVYMCVKVLSPPSTQGQTTLSASLCSA